MHLRIASILFALSATAYASSAQQHQDHGSLDSINEAISQLSYFRGEWYAQANEIDPETETTHPNATRNLIFLAQPVAEDQWYAFKWQAEKAGERFEGISLIGFDTTKGTFIERDISSTGAYGDAVSEGWQSNDLIFEGITNNWQGKTVKVRKTYHKLGPQAFELSIDISEDGETWVQRHKLKFAR